MISHNVLHLDYFSVLANHTELFDGKKKKCRIISPPLPFDLEADCAHGQDVEGGVQLTTYSSLTIQGRKIVTAVKTSVAGIASFPMWP